MSNVIRIACQGADTLELSKFIQLQEGIKELPELKYQKLKRLILEHGFSFPVNIWHNKIEDKHYIIDGHQRDATVMRMIGEDGFKLVDVDGKETNSLPICYVHAENIMEARRKVLAGASQFGEWNQDNLFQFMSVNEFESIEIGNDYDFAGLNYNQFHKDYFGETSKKSEKIKQHDTSNEKSQFIIKLDSVKQLTAMREMFGVAGSSTSYKNFIDCIG